LKRNVGLKKVLEAGRLNSRRDKMSREVIQVDDLIGKTNREDDLNICSNICSNS
jgi:hypothetical protein